MTFRIGVDIGGTFTDFTMYDEATGLITLGKVPTTPSRPDIGCLAAIRGHAGPIGDCTFFLHGTTVGLNALLERRGARVGLLGTEGFRDTIEIRRGSRPNNAPLQWVPPPPLVPRHLRLSVDERIDRDGTILRDVDPASIVRALDVFRSKQVDAIAVCLINAYANPRNEERVAELLRQAGYDGRISLSHLVSREYREYERASTTIVDAFVQARMSDYLDRVHTELVADGFLGQSLIMRSGGGSMTFGEAEQRSFETINSGPVAGAEGAAELSRIFGLGDLVTADVGGTSFDTCLIQNGRPHLLYQGEIAGQPIQASWIDVRSIGAGGGSIAYVDRAGLLNVGPRSAGAAPGPACYGRGGAESTTTDAAFLLGMLGRGELASGVHLDRSAALQAIRSVAEPLGLDAAEAAAGIIRIASAAMANAIREITIEQGIDTRVLKLLAIGGAGPMLATQIARELEIATIVVPPHAGNFSAWGLLGADIVRETARTTSARLVPTSMAALETLAHVLVAELDGRAELATSQSSEITEISFDLRFVGQEHSLTIAVPRGHDDKFAPADEIARLFTNNYLHKYGILPEAEIDVTAVRVLMRTPLPRRKAVERPKVAGMPEYDDITVHSFAFNRDLPARCYRRDELPVDVRFAGPAVVYEATTTTYVDADFSFRTDINDCMILTKDKTGA